MGFLEVILAIFWSMDLVVWLLCAHLLPAKVGRGWRWGLHVFFIGQILFAGFLYWEHAKDLSWVPVPLFVLFYVWHLLAAPASVLLGFCGLLGETIRRVVRFFRPEPEVLYADSGRLSRREFLGAVAALAPAAVTFSLGTVAMHQLSTFRVRRLTLSLSTLPPELEGMTIAHLSDLHFGQFTQKSVLREIVDETNRLKPDIAVFTGDLINSSLQLLPLALKTMKAIEAPLLICEGNHDVGFDRGGFEQRLKEAGLRLLLGEAETLQVRGVPVQLLGIPWDGPRNWQDRGQERNLADSVEAVLRLRDPGAFHILLAHHPHAWDYCGDVPLTLSGHTHGGQLMLNSEIGFGPWMFRYWTGLYTRPASPGGPTKALVVSNGVGNWFPLRTAAPAEIVHITLRRG